MNIIILTIICSLIGEIVEYRSLYTDYKYLHRNYKIFEKCIYSQTIKL